MNPIAALTAARGTLFPWVPVFLALGIGLWFSLLREPGLAHYGLAALVFCLCVTLWRWGPQAAQPVMVAAACIAVGFLAAGARGHAVSAPILQFRYYGPIEGRIVDIDRSQTNQLRLTLDRVVLERTSPDRTPRRVRVSLHGAQEYLVPEPGQVVILTGHLAAPEGPPEPGGFDFARMAYFQRLGAVGYTRTPALLLQPPERGAQFVNRIRTRLSSAVQQAIPGDPGAFSAGVMTGDRSGLSLQAVEDMRKSSLTHLLAISGMNMAFLTGFVFGALRYGMALIPYVALRVNSKKVAAIVSLGVAWFYLLLSGSNVATERAFIMVAVLLGAVLLDRRALSLRSVAISASILLLMKPESLMEPGFQMSFAATVALIAGFGALNGSALQKRIPRWTMPGVTLVLSSLLAGVATAPFGAAHFNRIADFGFIANLMTVPVMGAVVMPAGAVAAVAAPFGLETLPLWVMGRGSAWILWVSQWVAGWEGSITGVPAPGPWVLPLITLGALWMILWHSRARWLGIAVISLGFGVWTMAERPLVLISADAGLVGMIGDQGRAMSTPRGAGFSAKSWLENDGDLGDQEQAAMRVGFSGANGLRAFQIGDWRAVHLKGKGAEAAFTSACVTGSIVVIAAELPAKPARPCQAIDQTLLKRTGGLALWLDAQGNVIMQPAIAAQRSWTHRGQLREPAELPVLSQKTDQLAAAQ